MEAASSNKMETAMEVILVNVAAVPGTDFQYIPRGEKGIPPRMQG
jgi:hypothetical protein